MSRKTNSANKSTDVKVNDTNAHISDVIDSTVSDDNITEEPTNNTPAPLTDDVPTGDTKEEIPAEEQHDHFSNIVLSGKGKKLTPKSTSHIFFDVAEHDEEGELYLRISGNENGGLHSKEWINLTTIIGILDEQAGKSFKSTALKPVFKGASANNSGFLAGVLRSPDIGLIAQAGSSVFLHVLTDDYEEKKTKLLALT
ncbi:hypothetical protein [Moritella viscosa]|uniref:Uncharacterized protein n=1 Tax=Moritella viscosa TaxID=80854 RepID=A0A1L0FAT7_9GAMM|nr:hypothetical protein [Moritella viscosa]SGZ20360.1 Putative uncharacterized protein [Moritella viscosa]SHO06024.1 Putative uncharacterized protein [Moritella viscosa]SHO15464.1 Putative uncharacterized protein [Moritella viscosa]SHO15843.1 Putative uncharacterized protein [Moritella viscosa]SHO19087.1 Putative uncharacterized protein [Moritella viscosa]